MPQYTVPINGPNGPGFMTVNANDPGSAVNNASQGGNYATGAPISGGHQANSNGPGGSAQAGGGSSGGGGGGGGGGGSVSAAELDAQYQKMLQALASGNREAFEFEKQKFNQQFEEAKREFDLGRSDSLAQFEKNFGLSQGSLTGMYNGQPTEAARQFNLGLGKSLLDTAVSLRGPQDYLQYQQYTRGGQNLLQQLTGNEPIPQTGATQAQAMGQVQPATIQSILQQLGILPPGGQPAGAPGAAPGSMTRPPVNSIVDAPANGGSRTSPGGFSDAQTGGGTYSGGGLPQLTDTSSGVPPPPSDFVRMPTLGQGGGSYGIYRGGDMSGGYMGPGPVPKTTADDPFVDTPWGRFRQSELDASAIGMSAAPAQQPVQQPVQPTPRDIYSNPTWSFQPVGGGDFAGTVPVAGGPYHVNQPGYYIPGQMPGEAGSPYGVLPTSQPAAPAPMPQQPQPATVADSILSRFGLTPGQAFGPNQINPARYDAMGQIGRALTRNLAETQYGYDPTDFENQINAQRPTGRAPSTVRTSYRQPTGLF